MPRAQLLRARSARQHILSDEPNRTIAKLFIEIRPDVDARLLLLPGCFLFCQSEAFAWRRLRLFYYDMMRWMLFMPAMLFAGEVELAGIVEFMPGESIYIMLKERNRY